MQSYQQELNWLKHLIDYQIYAHLHSKGVKLFDQLPAHPVAPELSQQDAYGLFIKKHGLTTDERLLLMLALSVHIKAEFFNEYVVNSLKSPIIYPYIGLSFRRRHHAGFLPTGETVLFLLGGDTVENRKTIENLFGEQHFYAKDHLLWLDHESGNTSLLNGVLTINPSLVKQLLSQKEAVEPINPDLPLQYLSTNLKPDDLVLDNKTRKQLQVLQKSIKQLNSQAKSLKKGEPTINLVSLFYGQAGAGKTLAAILTGKQTKRAVYRIDLRRVVSTYIGETEKNLGKIFDAAEGKDWILFFDEADALFGKRTAVRDSHERYANQEVSYLLQRIESHSFVTIFATHKIKTIDKAFIAKCMASIFFPPSSETTRFQLWKKSLPKILQLPPDTVLQSISKQFDISGNTILRVAQYCATESLRRKRSKITSAQLIAAIKHETNLRKQGTKIKS